jgi:anaerobic selenocysteine-containing dehydrogenase
MSETISRREFLKIIGLGTAVSLVGSPGSPLPSVGRQRYEPEPGNSIAGQGTLFATTCGECSAGCGLLVRTRQGRPDRIVGNPDHPVNMGNTCARGLASLRSLYNPNRLQGPVIQASRGSGNFTAIDWKIAIDVVKDALQNGRSDGIAFLMGLFPDHLFDLVQLMANASGGISVLRYAALGEFEGRVTLMDATQKLFGVSKIPYFDLQHSDVVFSFGANFLETWISPVAYTRQYDALRQGYPGKRSYLVQFEPRKSQTAAAADEWIPIKPGTDALVAKALARLIAGLKQDASPQALDAVEVAVAAQESGVSEADLRRLARIFADAPRKLAIPGGVALGSANGLAAAQAILALNIQANNLGQNGGLFFPPDFFVGLGLVNRTSTIAEINVLIERMHSGQIKVLFVHGANPVYDLPAKLGFADALQGVPLIISFASSLDETALLADYVLPDHTPMESWGYQKVVTGGNRPVVSALQPVVLPLYDTRATADALLAAVRVVGGDLAAALPFQDELDYLQKSVASLIGQGGFYDETDLPAFWSRWRKYGGWWRENAWLTPPELSMDFNSPVSIDLAGFSGDLREYPFYLIIFPYSNQGDGHAEGWPWQSETQNRNAPSLWKTWVEINPATARTLGVRNADIVKISSSAGEIEAIVYEYPAIRPDVVAVPLWQGQAFWDRYPAGRANTPMSLLETNQNVSGNLAFMETRVKITLAG